MALTKVGKEGITGISNSSDATAITINSSEKVGIGDTSPLGNKVHIRTAGSATSVNGDAGLVLESDDSTRCDLQFMGPDGAFQSIYFGDVSDDNRGIIAYSHSGNNMRFTVDASERMRLTSDGLTFNGDTAAANALSDYEEGTWTPTVYGSSTAGSYTYTTTGNSPYANYTKIGRTVTLQVMLNNITQSSAGSGDVFIGGLPFNKMAGSAPFGCVHLNNWNTTGTITGVTVHPTTFANSGDVLQLTLDFDNSSSNSLSLSHLKSGSSDIGFSLVYFTA